MDITLDNKSIKWAENINNGKLVFVAPLLDLA